MKALSILILSIALILLNIDLCAQDASKKYLYLDSNANDTIVYAKINTLLKTKLSTEEKFELQKKQIVRVYALKQFDTAIFLCNKYILEQQTITDKHLAKLYLIKGSAYYYLFNLEKSLEAFEKAMPFAEKNKQYDQIFWLCNNIGGVCTDVKRYDKAEAILLKGLKTMEANPNKNGMAYYSTTRILATNYHYQKKNAFADSFYKLSINGFKSINEHGEYAVAAYTMYGKFLSSIGKADKAQLYLDSAITYQRGSKNAKDLTFVYYQVALAHNENNKYKLAATYFDSAFLSQYKEFTEVHSKDLAVAEKKFNTQILKRDIKIANQKKLNWIYAFILLAAIAVAIFLINRSNQKKKETRVKLEQHQVAVNAFVEGEEKEKTRLSRELHDGIGQELLALSMKLRQGENTMDAIAKVDSIGKEIRGLSHQLMPMTLNMLGLVAAMEEICDSLLSSSKIEHRLDVSGVEERLSPKIEISLYRIFQELVHNIVKHSAATMVQIQLIKSAKHINLIVEDNGIGFQSKEKHLGIGLNNLTSRVNMMNGQLRYESEDGEGTTTIVRVPI